MSKYLLTCLFVAIGFCVRAQSAEHFCAQHKQKQTQRKVRTSQLGAYHMGKYDVHHYHVNLTAQVNTLYLSGNTLISARALNDIDSFAFELHSNYTIDSVVYQGQSLSYHASNNEVYAFMPSPIPAGTLFTIDIHYHGTAPNGASSAIGNGYNQDNSPTWGNQVVWTLSQPYSAHEWFPCKQALQDKADSSKVYITTSDSNRAGSNGILVGVDTLSNNRLCFKWHNNSIIDYYLISFAISQYVDYSYYVKINNGQDSVLYQNYVYDNPATLPYFKAQIDTTALMLTYLDSLLTPYPFAKIKYGHCQAPLGGGMEHQTMTTIGAFSFDIDAHELMHQWFGDLVTCRTWKDIWVNEGFASYGEYIIRERFRSYTSAQNKMRSVHSSVKSQPGGSVYTYSDTSNSRVFSSRLSYNKGSAVIHTLRFILGDSLFYAGMRNFLTQYSYGNATNKECRMSFEQTTGINLQNFEDEWLNGSGYPIYSGEYNSTGNAIVVKLNVATTSTTPLFTNPLELRLKSPSGDTTVRVAVSSNSNVYVFPSKKQITDVVVDPNNWIVDSAKAFIKSDVLFPTALEEATQTVSIIPNPAHHLLTVQHPLAQQIILYDLSGKQIRNQLCDNGTAQIIVSDVAAGLYQVQVQLYNGSKLNRLVQIRH